MNEQHDIERRVAESVSSVGRMTPSEGAVSRTINLASRKRQRPTWLALIKEPPMRTHSTLAVGSPTARFVAILAATLLLSVALVAAGIAGSRLFAADGPIVVDGSGDGDYTTITAALLAAEDGDEIVIRPGTYAESVVVDLDVTLRGDGEPGSVILTGEPDAGPAILLDASDAIISDLTLSGLEAGVLVIDGAPTLTGLVFEGVGETFTGEDEPQLTAITLAGGTTAHVTRNELRGGGIILVEASAPTIEINVLGDGPNIYLDGALEETVVIGNVIRAPGSVGIGMSGAGAYLVEGNEVHGGEIGITVFPGDGVLDDRLAPTIRSNIVTASAIGMKLSIGSEAVATDNELTSVETGIVLDRTDSIVRGNHVEAELNGVVVFDQGSPTIVDNDIEAGAWALITFGDANPTVSGNRLCGGQGSAQVGGEPVPVEDGNTGCDSDAPSSD